MFHPNHNAPPVRSTINNESTINNNNNNNNKNRNNILIQLQDRNHFQSSQFQPLFHHYQSLHQSYHELLLSYSQSTSIRQQEELMSRERHKRMEVQSKLLELMRDKTQIMDSMLSLTDHLQLLERQLEEQKSRISSLTSENEQLEKEATQYKMENDLLLIEIGRRDEEILSNDRIMSELRSELKTLRVNMDLNSQQKHTVSDLLTRVHDLESIVEQKTLNHQVQLEHMMSQLQMESNRLQMLERETRSARRLSSYRTNNSSNSCNNNSNNSSDNNNNSSNSNSSSSSSSSGTDIGNQSDKSDHLLWGISRQSMKRAMINEPSMSSDSWNMKGARSPISCDSPTQMHFQRSQSGFKFSRGVNAHTKCINSIAFSPSNDMIASGSDDHKIHIWDRNLNLLRTLEGPKKGVMNVSFSNNGQLLLGTSLDENIYIWRSTKSSLPKCELSGHSSKVLGGCFVSENTVLSGSHDKTIKVWDILTGKCKKTFLATSSCNDIVSLSEELSASCHFDRTIKLWDTRKNTNYGLIQSSHTEQIASVSPTADGRYLLSNSKDNSLKVFDLRTQKELLTLTHSLYISGPFWSKASICATGNGYTVAAISDHSTKNTILWHMDSKFLENGVQLLAPEKQFRKFDDRSVCSAHSVDGSLIASCQGGFIHLYSKATIKN